MTKFIFTMVFLSSLVCRTSFGSEANMGTGQVLKMNLNLDNCEGVDFMNFGVGSGNFMDEIIANHGPIRVCYPNAEALEFTKFPQPADPNSEFVIYSSTEENEGSGWVTDGRQIFIIALKNGLEQYPAKSKMDVFRALIDGIDIVQGVDPSIDEEISTDSGNVGLE